MALSAFGRLFARQTAEISLFTDPEELDVRLSQPFDVEELVAGLSDVRCRLSVTDSSRGPMYGVGGPCPETFVDDIIAATHAA